MKYERSYCRRSFCESNFFLFGCGENEDAIVYKVDDYLNIELMEVWIVHMKNQSVENPDISETNIPSNLFVLKHKDLDVAMVAIDLTSGKIEHVLDVYLPEELPVGCNMNNPNTIISWWESRAIPDSRRGIQQALKFLHEESSLSLMLSGYGLSLADHYWMQPLGEELYWKDLNFFENTFSDELGLLLTDSEKIDVNANISKFSPSSSVTGEMKKKWILKGNGRYLMKLSVNDYAQQAVNEVIATSLHKHLGWKNYVSYEIETTKMEGKEIPCSLNPLFTSTEYEFVSAYQLIKNYKIPNEQSSYEAIIEQSIKSGMSENIVREQLEYTILTDFILTNVDRHFNNFGFLYDSEKKQFVAMAPIFDTGNSLFYNYEVIPQKENLLDIRVNSFSKREIEMLRYVKNPNLLDLEKLDGFADEVQKLLMKYTDMPDKRAGEIAQTVEQKIEYIKMFQQGKKIWKKKKYW